MFFFSIKQQSKLLEIKSTHYATVLIIREKTSLREYDVMITESSDNYLTLLRNSLSLVVQMFMI